MLGNSTQWDHEGHPIYNKDNLSSSGMASQLAWLDLAKILKGADVQSTAPEEKQMDLPLITGRQKRVAKDKNIPPKIRKREIPRLSGEIQKGLNTFALGNMLFTLHDIDGLMYTLKIELD